LDQKSNFLDKPVGDVMGRNPKWVIANSLAQEALAVMSQYQIDQVIVADENNKPVGMLDLQDFIALTPR